MMKFHRGQIWLVNFDPSIGHEYRKIRPAIIIQQDKYITSNSLLTIVPISSQTASFSKLDILITKDSQNRLMKDSLIKIKQVSSFDNRRFIKLIGRASDSIMKNVDINLGYLLFGK